MLRNVNKYLHKAENTKEVKLHFWPWKWLQQEKEDNFVKYFLYVTVYGNVRR